MSTKRSTKRPQRSNSRKEVVHKSSLEESRELLHTFHVPDVILKRENECAAIRKFIRDGIKTNSNVFSRVLCISGVPGTGKTASVLWGNFCSSWPTFVLKTVEFAAMSLPLCRETRNFFKLKFYF
uniref:Origin recognition complex subunit 1 n=1 Tax=Meloidogyne incognita TaxID=6306 RepID=A0A914M896_MELIC